MVNNPPLPFWLRAAPVIFLFLWSNGYVAAKYSLAYAEPMTLLVLRFATVILIMAGLFVVLRPPVPKTAMGWSHLAIVGFLLQAVYFGMCYLAFQAGIAVGTLALLLSLQPILTAMVAPGLVREQIGWRRWFGLGLGLLGALIVIIARSDIDTPSMLALFCAVLALAGITVGTLWEKRFGVAHHPVVTNLVGYAAGLIGVVPFMLALETMNVEWTLPFGIAFAYLVIGNSVIAVGLLLAMIRAGEVSRVSALFFLVPPIAALSASLILDERMPPAAWLGMAIATLGVYIATRRQAQG